MIYLTNIFKKQIYYKLFSITDKINGLGFVSKTFININNFISYLKNYLDIGNSTLITYVRENLTAHTITIYRPNFNTIMFNDIQQSNEGDMELLLNFDPLITNFVLYFVDNDDDDTIMTDASIDIFDELIVRKIKTKKHNWIGNRIISKKHKINKTKRIDSFKYKK